MKKIDPEHPMYDILQKNQARLTNITIDEFLQNMFEHIQDDEEQLKKVWRQIAEKWFSCNYVLPLPKRIVLIHGYMLLDYHPLFRDKMKKGKNTMDNILRDASHCFFASNAQYFVSEDSRIRKKNMFFI